MERYREILDQPADDSAVNFEYAGFWLRFGAYVLDSVLLNIFGAVAGLTLGAMESSVSGGSIGVTIGYYAIVTLIVAVGLLYYPIMESGKQQATLGKIAVGIKVTDYQGQRISFGRALLRFLAKIPSAAILLIGFIIAAFTEKKQALHDMMVSTYVINR